LSRNTFVYLLAGHETTAHSLVYMFGLLALYPEEQRKLYIHIKEIVGNREAVRNIFLRIHDTFNDHFKRLLKTFLNLPEFSRMSYFSFFKLTNNPFKSAFNETLRMFPPVLTIAKRTSAPTVFSNVTAADPSSDAVKDMVVPAGTTIYINTAGLHYNGILYEMSK
jgi:cytochrome P450